jgi:hypothetical protein
MGFDSDQSTRPTAAGRPHQGHAIAYAVLAALTVLGALQRPALAAATPVAEAQKAVIQPGQETLVADMLGKGVTLPDGCAFADGRIEAEAVAGTYRCASGDVGIELRHPSIALPDAHRTAQFALTVTKGTAPPALIDALTARIRAHEDKFEWTMMATGPAPLPLPWIGAGVLVLVLAAAAWWMRRRAQRAN